jgi:hypothetical protein
MKMKNPTALFKVKGLWEQFVQNHPKFPMFLNAVKAKGIPVDSVIEVKIIQPDGEEMKTNIKITSSDMELLEQLRGMV